MPSDTGMHHEGLSFVIPAGEPDCYDPETCHQHCSKVESLWSKYGWLLIPVGCVILLCFLTCLVGLCCLNPRLREKAHSKYRGMRGNAPSEKQQIDPAGSPSTLAGPAAGAASAASATAGDQAGEGADRGTTSRRAEEGRSRVNFADGGAAGGNAATTSAAPSENAQVVKAADPPATTAATTTTAPSTAEHTEPVPVHDGADSVTGRSVYDMSSMRGRPRARGE
jgi:hypothetical protein